MDEEQEDSLAAINARGRRKALRRLLLATPPVLVFIAVFVVSFAIGLGIWLSLGAAVIPSVGLAIALEKLLPHAHED